jgi:ABC-type branched-subunit amino acid transport system substrate-binding protein
MTGFPSPKLLFVSLVALMVAAITLAAEESPTGPQVLETAKKFYAAGAHDSTIATIRAFLKKHGKDPEAEYLVPLIMESFLRKDDYGPVNKLFNLYQKKFRSSPFMPRVHYLHGCALVKDRSYPAAFEAFSLALDGGVSGDLDTLIMRGTRSLCQTTIDAGDLHDIGKESKNNPRIREIARYYEVMKMIAQKADEGKIKKRIAEFKEDFPNSKFLFPLGEAVPTPVALTPAPPPSKKGITLGFLAPLTGDDAEVGKKALQGAQLAIDKFNCSHSSQFKLASYDTRGALLETVRKTQELVDRDRAPLIIGPMLSPTATVAAAFLIGKDAVMMTPTATEDGIAELGPNIFQMNVTTGILSRKLARYALANLNIREFAVVAPRSAYGGAMAAAFRDEVEKGGGSVFDEEFFEEGGNDFRAQFVALRRKLLMRKLDDSLKAAGTFVKPRTKVSAADSVKWADSTLPIGAIFMPGEADDIVMLAPQVSYNRIRAQLLGSNGWHAPKTVADGKHYVQNAILSTFFEPDTSWKPWADFRRDYVARYHEEPDRVAALGYDAGTVAATAIDNAGGSSKTSKISESLLNIQRFEGAAGTVTFDKNSRTNSDAVILKINASGFVRVQ